MELQRIRQALISTQVKNSKSFYIYRDNIRVEGEVIRSKLTQKWQTGECFDLEKALVVNTVACAILNPSKDLNVLYF
jgi:hypothetical protein